MLIQTKFNAKVINSFQKEFENKSAGTKGEYYQLGIMTDEGLATLKCNKDVHEAVVKQTVSPMQTCDFLAVFDPDKKDFRVVGIQPRK